MEKKHALMQFRGQMLLAVEALTNALQMIQRSGVMKEERHELTSVRAYMRGLAEGIADALKEMN